VSCGYEGFLDRRLLGEAAPGEIDAFKAHVDGCPPCHARWQEASTLERLLVGSLRVVEDAFPPPRASVLARLDEVPRLTGSESQRLRSPRLGPGRRVPRQILTLTVMTALTLLVLHLLYAAFLVREQRRIMATIPAAKARTDVRTLGIAAEAYRRGERALPPDGIRNLVEALSRARAATGRPYYAFRKTQLDAGREYHDPWGQPYVYRAAGGTVVLYSLGENGRDEGGRGDDVTFALAR